MTPTAIREIIAGDGPTIVYQPIVRLGGSLLVEGYEALSRFPDGNPPNLWFDAAWREGLGPDLERVALETAIDGFRPGYGYLAVNLSPTSLLDPTIQEILLDGHDFPISLVIELSEREVISDYQIIRDILIALREFGISLAIDDLGAGFSSLLHVLRLQPEHVKIDHDLTRNVPQNPYENAVVAAIVAMARALSADVVAEGVERQEQADALRILGVNSGQGWFFARPGPLPEGGPILVRP